MAIDTYIFLDAFTDDEISDFRNLLANLGLTKSVFLVTRDRIPAGERVHRTWDFAKRVLGGEAKVHIDNGKTPSEIRKGAELWYVMKEDAVWPQDCPVNFPIRRAVFSRELSHPEVEKGFTTKQGRWSSHFRRPLKELLVVQPPDLRLTRCPGTQDDTCAYPGEECRVQVCQRLCTKTCADYAQCKYVCKWQCDNCQAAGFWGIDMTSRAHKEFSHACLLQWLLVKSLLNGRRHDDVETEYKTRVYY